MDRHVMCITGMHRSGTSLVAAWLQRCGLIIDVGGLVGPDVGNERGHFEDLELMNLHREEFLARNARSRGWKLSRPEFLSFTGDRRERAARIFEARGERFPEWGWKDPRTLAFLPDWKEIAPALSVLILWRPATDVVASLTRRSHSSSNPDMAVRSREALSSWNSYNELALRYQAEHPSSTLLVRLDYLLRHDREVLGLVIERFGVALEPKDIGEVFDARLLSQAVGSPGLERYRARTSRHRRIRALEARLASASVR